MKDLKIGRELIKAVLQKETEILSKDFNFTINEDYIEFSDDGEMQFEYCIYKFAFKCKEWAYSKGYVIKNWCCNIGIAEIYSIEGQGYLEKRKDVERKEELDAIIKSCEWVLSEVNR